jgi:hypothetical protein
VRALLPFCAAAAIAGSALAQAGAAPARAAAPAAAQAGDGEPSYADDEVAASAGDARLTWKELDPVIASRRVLSEDGREALKHLAQSIVLERLAKENGISVPDAVVDARWKDLDEQVKASGDREGIVGMMKKVRLSPDEFRRYLRLSFVQETLTRRALGLAEKAEVKGEQQELWMEEAMRDRSYKEFGPPWKDGVVAQCTDFSIRLPDLLAYLRRRLPPQDLREDCYQVLLLRRLRAKTADVAPEKVEKAIDEEIARRKEEAAAEPRNKGVAWERLIAAEGYVVETIREDAAIRIAALARLWVDRTVGPDGLKKAYEADRTHFDGLYGAAIDTSMLYMRAAQFKNELNPRSFQEAERELETLAKGIASFEDFQRLARERSEEAVLRANGGALGFVGTGSEKIPREIREEVAKALAAPGAGGAGTDPSRSLTAPVRLPTGVALLWLGERRPAPTWDTMAVHVHREMRRRVLEETLAKNAVVTTFEVP